MQGTTMCGPWLAAAATPGNFLEMQISCPPDLLNQKFQSEAQESVFHKVLQGILMQANVWEPLL